MKLLSLGQKHQTQESTMEMFKQKMLENIGEFDQILDNVEEHHMKDNCRQCQKNERRILEIKKILESIKQQLDEIGKTLMQLKKV